MDEYGLPDLRQLMASRSTQFCTTLQFPEPFSVHHYQQQPSIVVGTDEVVPAGGGLLADHHHYTSIMSGGGAPSSGAALYGVDLEQGWNNNGVMNDGGNNNVNCRWPRQETLTLLEIRSALDSKFKETNQKGPLWDEVSRIMAEEHGYQRSGKKCKEKFENLYKYYKKTKEGKAGRQDGKNYRFFRQLESIYGDQTSPNQSSIYGRLNPLLYHTTPYDNINADQNREDVVRHQKLISSESLSFSNNSTEFDQTSSSENNDKDDLSLSAIDFMMHQSMGKLKNENQSCAKVRKSWKAKVDDFVNSQIGKVIKTQEAWMEKVFKSIEHREEEFMAKEEEWRKQEAARFDKEVHEFWAKERAWVETRDAAIMEALSKFTRKETNDINNKEKDHISKGQILNGIVDRSWTEHEVACLIELRTSVEELTFEEGGYFKEGIWEMIATKMGCLGYNRSVGECKGKWENVSVCCRMTKECNKKRKEDTKTNMYFSQLSSNEGQEVPKRRPGDGNMGLQLMDEGLSLSSSNMDVNSSSFRMPFNIEGEILWDRYHVKMISKANNQ